MRILKVLPWYLPATGFGGPVIRIQKVSKRLVEWGHEVKIFTTNMQGPNKANPTLPEYEIIDNIEVRRFPVIFKLR